MTPEKKKLWLYGGGAAALTLLVYFIFFNKPSDKGTKPPTPPKPPKPQVDPDYPDYPPVPNEEPQQVTTRSGTRLREKPTTDSAILKTYSAGVKLTVIGSEDMLDGVWYQISSPRGWVRSDVVD
jgi:uncharacterized protein YgiM (DUF1202 family)